MFKRKFLAGVELMARINLQDIIGRQFGRLTIVDVYRNHKSHVMTKARCSCGKDWTGYFNNLQKGGTRSCGCLAKEHKNQYKGNHA